MNSRKVLFTAISIACVLAIIAAIWAEIDLKNGASKIEKNRTKAQVEIKTQEDLKKDFNNMFNNSIDFKNYDESSITKYDNSKELVYSAFDMENREENKYEIDLHIPVINIKNEVGEKFNNITQEVFANKANEIFKEVKAYTIYSVTYTGYINDDILSVIIKSTLKEGYSAQRVIVQTYNYNLKTNKEVSLQDIIEQKNIEKSKVEAKIKTEVTKAIKETNKIQASGYETYSRDFNSDIYNFDNISTFFLNNEGKLYIIFAYGNNNFTAEMDIIEI